MTQVRAEADHRTAEQVRADEEIAALAEGGRVGEGFVEETIPSDELWAVHGVLFAAHLGLVPRLHREHRLAWEDQFRRELVERHAGLKALLATAGALTPEIERAIRNAVVDFRTRFRP